ncbi:hypothetical protein H1O16_gp032 [Burkholderia phage BcepSaruman]|uniref:Uncharacterized protein n=1 Tax=Burkholderia phage BcepSaruman TaxID=2530032 RepID=A0A4D5ZBT1_9CAUD|nr:hypothetical protein H1O16_gp032 [Burkholderia phage BcepSaruman]QBX06445.1 hypothetical protein BcepSaruman_032 [Burkholderia phage BcepSaruman]
MDKDKVLREKGQWLQSDARRPGPQIHVCTSCAFTAPSNPRANVVFLVYPDMGGCAGIRATPD